MAEKIDVTKMSVEEKAAKFDEMQGKKDVRRAGSKAKKAAMSQLIKNHQPEYNKLLTAAGGKPKA